MTIRRASGRHVTIRRATGRHMTIRRHRADPWNNQKMASREKMNKLMIEISIIIRNRVLFK
jgi:hypothetical protein